MQQVLDNWQNSVTIGPVKMTNLRFADDTTLLAALRNKLQFKLDILEQISATFGLSINYNKAKVLIVDRERQSWKYEDDEAISGSPKLVIWLTTRVAVKITSVDAYNKHVPTAMTRLIKICRDQK